MSRTQISLPDSLLAYVRQVARKSHLSMSAVIRALIEEQMARPQAVMEDPFFELGSSPRRGGPKDGSVEHDHYLYGRRHR